VLTTIVNLQHKAGDDLVLGFTVTDENGNVADITGAICRFEVARTVVAEPVLSTETSPPTAEAEVTNPTGGAFEVRAEGSATDDFVGSYVWEAEVEDLSGGKSTVAQGLITFDRQLIRS
jgi:hypothetical protein